MVSVNNLGVEFSARPLFTDVSFVINKSDRIALVGKNGAGKSTLLKIIAGMQTPSEGSISVPNDVTVGYLPQEMRTSDDTTLINETRKAFSDQLARHDELDRLNAELANRTDYESESYAALIEKISFLSERIAMDGADNMEAEIERTLIGLGFSRSDFQRPTSEFSGGWRMRVELAKILLRRPDLLLLDEPTNHLDIE
ncbi:MAG: ATP-binding cassette domain-containing protein, partial [Muribaculaceae bacterium]|nr:ATP-binding cassette domain-containing protein [Muribaculaceae bacterium]